MKKIQEMVQVKEKLRIPIAQGLPWTTDEPEVAEKMNLIEQYKMERERQQKVHK
ncbi:hypothetical protein Pint_19116 [Pistacia integerrima]|uniref:Uncharacterized protein n=1 Tax=Pistacia integerrima TaxID=434235 RepID=A0ACC0YZW6_9ROSI|nr:hypothetical protein Pint_19116 [Pistacia integerrima]